MSEFCKDCLEKQERIEVLEERLNKRAGRIEVLEDRLDKRAGMIDVLNAVITKLQEALKGGKG